MKTLRSAQFITLTVLGELRASHSLEGFEAPHYHLWKIQAQFQTSLPLKNDRVIDLIFLQTNLDAILLPYQTKHLNRVLPFSPTSENISLWIWDQLNSALPDLPVYSVDVSLCNLQGVSTGSARVFA